MRGFDDPLQMPGSGESPEERYAQTVPLVGTAGQIYVERRGVPVDVADAAGVRFDANFGSRPAVLVPLCDQANILVSVHGRYLHNVRRENKMLTIGPSGGIISVLGGWRAKPIILVEGLFDALSLATCGWASVATIGRWTSWLPEVSANRVVWLAFDATKPGEADAAKYGERLNESEIRRLRPPPRCKDWNTALLKCGRSSLTRWVRDCLNAGNLNRL